MNAQPEPRWDSDWEYGRQGELYVADTLATLRRSGAPYEVKTERRARDRIYVEFECRGRPSGLQTTEALLWIFVLGERALLVVPTADLRQLARRAWRQESNRVDCPRGSHPTRGVAIPLRRVAEWLAATEPA